MNIRRPTGYTRGMNVHMKRAYEDASKSDGYRVLIDRLWPRGISKEDASIDDWLKDLAPSTSLRKWFDHDPERFDEFREKYIDELRDQRDTLTELRRRATEGRLTLVYGAKDEEHNDAVVLTDVLKQGLPHN